MRRVVALLLAALVLGCGSAAPSGDPVQLLTGDVPGYTVNERGEHACFTDFAVGQLVVDPKYGTAITDETSAWANGGYAPTTPVMWRPGFTGRRVGSEIVVVDPTGNVVATTGRSYKIAGGYWFENPRAFVACAGVTPQ